jgi:SAM-dependent methyltransferase
MMDLFSLVPDSDIRTWVGPFADKNTYFESGQSETERFVRLAGIKPYHGILDIGCWCGKTAIHFPKYLSARGSYTGVDNNRELLNFCIEKIKPLFPNFQFLHVDVFNRSYNPGGKLSAGTLRLPLPDSSIDVIIANSLFTHMFIGDIRPYLEEMVRVLKTGGTTLCTFFLLNERSRDSLARGQASPDFRHPVGKMSLTLDQAVPEEGIAHDEKAVAEMFLKAGLKLRRIENGSWIDKGTTNLQDLMITEK